VKIEILNVSSNPIAIAIAKENVSVRTLKVIIRSRGEEKSVLKTKQRKIFGNLDNFQ